MSYYRCRLAKQDNVVQGSHSKLGLPVLFIPSFNILGGYFYVPLNLLAAPTL